MKKILFPTDFSKNSLHAFAYALQLAKKIKAEILTMHVYSVDAGYLPNYTAFLAQNYNLTEWSDFENYKSEVPKLKQLAEKYDAASVRMSHILERGEVVDKILEIEESENIDCIVMGTKGATGLAAIFLGTVAEQVINRASGMVLAIPPDCTFSANQKIMLLAKFEKPYLKILRQVLDFAKLLEAPLDVVQIKDAPDKNDSRTIKEWSREFADAAVSFQMLATGGVEETAVDFAKSHHSSLIAFSVQEKGFLERLFFFSLSRQMAFHSHVPVLAIHSKKIKR